MTAPDDVRTAVIAAYRDGWGQVVATLFTVGIAGVRRAHIGAEVVAEGIETAEESAELRCRLGQGHHLGRPRPPERDGNARVAGEMSGVG